MAFEKWIALSAGLSLVAACGGSESAPPETASDEHAEHHAHHQGGHHEGGHHQGGHHAELPEPLARFHDVLHPIWHSEPEGRSEMACHNVEQLTNHSQAIRDMGVPEGVDPAPWASKVDQLSASIDALAAVCPQSPEGHDAEVTQMHDAFHGMHELLEAAR